MGMEVGGLVLASERSPGEGGETANLGTTDTKPPQGSHAHIVRTRKN